ncbi:transposase [Pararobbsia alpina]|uniref:transposase n=1 Tax=Pararobbsia alpina TaxID=621374 RepID=UPI001C2E2EB4
MVDLSDDKWQRIEYLFDAQSKSRTRGRLSASPKAVLNAIRWIQRSRERWLYLPANYPPQQTCYAKYLQWKGDGRLSEVKRLLAESPDPPELRRGPLG